jgi:hypothetical protein
MCGCTDIQQSVIDLANTERVVDVQKLEIELLKKENARLRDALEFIKSTMDEEKINLEMMRQVEYCAREALERHE